MVFMNLFICDNFIFCHFSWRKIIVLVYLDKQFDKFKLSMLLIFLAVSSIYLPSML
jgi:hypothetical protein